MLDVEKIRSAVLTLGWPKAIYFACLLLLLRHAVNFDQCLILLLVAVGIDFLPLRSRRKSDARQITRTTKKMPQAASQKKIKANFCKGT